MAYYGGANPIQQAPGPVTSVNGEVGDVSLDIPSDAEVAALAEAEILANDQLGAMAPAVQSLVNAGVAYAIQRGIHTGTDNAASIVFTSDNLSLDQWRALVDSRGTAGTNDPTVDTSPSLAGTVGVGNTLTLTRGTVTDGSGGGHLDVLNWYFIAPTTGLVSLLFAETIASASTPSTFAQTAAHVGGTIYVIQQAKDTVTSKLSNARTSNVKGPVTGTAPTNTGTVPTVSGSAASGSAISVLVGVWTGAATYSVQLYADGVPYGSPSAKAASTTVSMGNSDNSIVGKVLTARITAYSSLDVPSATAVLTSNSITVTGTAPTVTNTAVPAWPATINFGTKAVGTIGTWTGSIHAVRSYEFYIGVPDSTPDFGPQALFEHTPRSPAVVGDTLYVIERVYDAATGTIEVGNAVSAGKVISAAIATFAAALTTEGAAGYAWTQSSAISQATIATLSGGTQPWVLDPTTPFSPALPAGISVSISGANVIATGTPSVVSSSTSYTINFKDSAGSPASASVAFGASVAAPGVTPLPVVTPSGSINLNGATTLIADPLSSGIQVYKSRVTNPSYPSDTQSRAEQYEWSDADANNLVPANDFWGAFRWCEDTSEYTRASSLDDEMVIIQTHTRGQGDTQPDIKFWIQRQSGNIRWSSAYNTHPPSDWNYNGGAFPDTEGQTHLHSEVIPSPGVAYYYIVHYRPGYTSGHAPKVEVWRSKTRGGAYEKIVDSSALNTYNVTGAGVNASYWRMGCYKYNGSKWNSAAISQILSKLAFKKGTNLYAEAVAYLATL